MSTFSETTFDADHYDRCRPSYPKNFYAILDEYHRGPRHCLIDAGCGPGTATFQMATWLPNFDKVIGSDISATMIERALASCEQDKRVSFVVSSSDDYTFLGDTQTDKQVIDMITAVECVHWFDFAQFQSAVAANLRPGGTFAIWGYADAVFVDYPELDAVLDHVAYGEDALGPFWEQPGRSILRGMLHDWVFDRRFFTDELEVSFRASELRGSPASASKNKPLVILNEMTVSDYVSYIKTWSAYHVWKRRHGKSDPDIAEELFKKISAIHPELKPDSRVKVAWNTFYKFARRV